jgi:hypothetical protein
MDFVAFIYYAEPSNQKQPSDSSLAVPVTILIINLFVCLDVVLTDRGDIIAYRHGLHLCQEVNPHRNQNKV